MARKEGTAKPERRIFTLRFILRTAIAGALIVTAMIAWHRLELYLIRDARFAMALPDYGLESPSLQISGIQYTSRIQVLRIFSPDYGRSIYLLPLKQRREQLRSLDWVKEASISRIWPNRVLLQIQEREPVAFLNLPSEQPGVAQVALIDAEGVILQQPHAKFNLPVAVGIRRDETAFDRRARVRRLLTLMNDVGPLGSRVSEVDVTDPDDLRITVQADRRAVTLMMGDHNFGKRLQNFVTHYPKIQERLANAAMLDMRLEDRITVVEANRGSQ